MFKKIEKKILKHYLVTYWKDDSHKRLINQFLDQLFDGNES